MDWKTWGIRLTIVGAAALLFVGSSLLHDPIAADGLKGLAGMLVGLLMPQLAKGAPSA